MSEVGGLSDLIAAGRSCWSTEEQQGKGKSGEGKTGGAKVLKEDKLKKGEDKLKKGKDKSPAAEVSQQQAAAEKSQPLELPDAKRTRLEPPLEESQQKLPELLEESQQLEGSEAVDPRDAFLAECIDREDNPN